MIAGIPHRGPFASPLAAALSALEILGPGDDATRLAILKVIGFRPADTAATAPLIDVDALADIDIDDTDEKERRRSGLKVVSSVDQPPPLVPSELVPQDDAGDAPPPWLDQVPTIALPNRVSDPFSEPMEPLLAPNYTRAIISRLAAHPLPLGEVDLDRVIRRTERCLPFRSVPRRLLPSLARGVQLLIDTHEGMQPFRLDIRGLIRDMRNTVGRDRVELLRFKGCPLWGVQRHPLQTDDRYHPPDDGRLVIIVSDLGIGAIKEAGARPGMASWSDFMGRLKRTGGRATCLIPYGPKHWPKAFPSGLKRVVWDRTTTVTSLERTSRSLPRTGPRSNRIAFIHPRLASASPDAVRLGILAAMATRIEPQLLRQLRLELATDLNVGAEAALWHSDLVQERAPTGIVIRTEIRTMFQHRLAQMPHLFEAAYQVVRKLHRRSAPVLQLEEKLVYHVLKGDKDQVRQLLQSMVATLVSPNRQGIVGWTSQALLRIPIDIKDYEEVKMLAAGTALRLGKTAALERFKGGGAAGVDWIMPRQREIKMGLNLRESAVEFGPATMRAAHQIRVPDTSVVVVELSWTDDDRKQHKHYLRIQPGQRKIFTVDGDVLDLVIIGGRRYRLAAAESQLRSSQKRVGRNRPPRVQIEYDVELYGQAKSVALPFVIGVMSGLSGIASADRPPLSERRFLDIDVDNFDERMAAIQPAVAYTVPNRIDGDGELSVELVFANLEQFGPDAVVDRLPWLASLRRQRKRFKELVTAIKEDPTLAQAVASARSTSARPAKGEALGSWLPDPTRIQENAPDTAPDEKLRSKSRDETRREQIRKALQSLPDTYRRFPQTAVKDGADSVRAVIREINNLLGAQVREIIHHPDFQELEGAWRGLYYLLANTETGEQLKIRYLDVSKQELHRSLRKNKGARWDRSTIFKRIISDAFDQLGGEPYGCLVGDYYFDHSAADVEMLGEIAKIAAAAHAPFIAGASPSVLGMQSWAELMGPHDLERRFHAPDYAPWRSLRKSEDARFIGLTMPRFLGRLPYGAGTHPVEAFDFEEISNQGREAPFVWANAAYAMAANICRSFSFYGWCSRIRGIESGGAVEGLPVHTFPMDDGGVDMKCPTEIGIGDRREAELAKSGFMPLVHRKNSDFAVFIGAQSLQAPAAYDSPDVAANANLAVRLPYTFALCRFTNYLKCLVRDKIGSFTDRQDMERYLQGWIMQYVDGDPDTSSETVKALKPLAAAKIMIEEFEGDPSYYFGMFYLRPHYQLEGLTLSLRSTVKLPSLG